MVKKRTTRKQLLKEPDEFITLTGRLIQWARENSKQLVYGACTFVAILIFIAAHGYYREKREHAAAALLSQSIAAYQQERTREPEQAAPLTVSAPDFERLVSQYGRYPAGRLGKIISGHIHLAGGDPDAAVTFYEKAWADFGKDPSLRPVILNGLAEAYARKGDTASAIAHYEKIATGKQALFVDTALFHLGRLYRMAGEADKSKHAYERLAAEFPDSLYADMAREKTAG